MISTRDLSLLPDVESLRRIWQSMAMLDAILCPDWEYRYYSFNAAWGAGEQLGSMRSGSGDSLMAHFGTAGCWLKGFAHESPLSPWASGYRDEGRPAVWPGVLDVVPVEFADCLQEPAFNVDETTFCLWRRPGDRVWQMGPVAFPPDQPDPDGSEFLLSPLDGKPATYWAWATDYYETEIELAAVEHIYQHRELTPEIVERLNPNITLKVLAADIEEIAYPGQQAG
jgi:hypothetical protein